MSRNFLSGINPWLVVASAGMAITCPTAGAADYVLTASGPLSSISSFSDTFDGTNHGTLPSHLNLDALAGGSFRASFRFSTSIPDDPDATFAIYDFPGISSGQTFELLNASGAVVHQGGDFNSEGAFVANDDGNPPYVVDQVLITTLVNTTTNIHVPAPVYSATPDRFSVTSISCFSYVDANTNFLTDLQIPIDPAIYLAFPNRIFEVYDYFGDGDASARILPFQYLEDIVDYKITSVNVTAVPEPAIVGVLAPAMLLIVSRRRSRQPVPSSPLPSQ